MTPRDLVCLGCLAGATLLFARAVNAEDPLVPARAAVDHLLLGVSDLDRGIAWVEEKTGVRAVVGGTHPGRGTRNALLSLGGRQYLEIIAPDPAQPASVQPAHLLALQEPRLIGWAAATADIEGVAKKGREAGQRLMGPRDGSRARPDGTTLKWKTLSVATESRREGADPMPFFIEWAGDSVHPSQDSPKGCKLVSFAIAHPDAAAIAASLKQLGIDAQVSPAQSPALIATLETPKGAVTLGAAQTGGSNEMRAAGTFDVKLTPQETDDGKPDGPALGRMTIDKQFHGDLEGMSKGAMLTAAGATFKNSAGYVAIERFSGTVKGRKGTFALQHSGTMNRGAPHLEITVVPDSGTGDLAGLSGSMTIRIEGAKHFYEFGYTVPR